MLKNKLYRRVDAEGLLGAAGLTFMARVVSAAAAFGLNIVLARVLSVAEAGLFFLSLTVLTAVSIVARFGMDHALIRFVSPAWEKKKIREVVGLSLQGFALVSGIGVLATALLYTVSDWLAVGVFDEAALTGVLRAISLAVVPFSLLWAFSGALKAVRLSAHANFLEAGFIPVVVGSVLAVLFIADETLPSPEIAAMAYAVAALVGVMWGSFLFIRRTGVVRSAQWTEWSTLTKSAWPLAWVAVLNFTILSSSSLFLGFFSGPEAVAQYNVAHRTAILISFILVVFNSVAAPRFASLYSEGKLAELEKVATKVSVLMSFAALPIFAATMLFPEEILSIFGSEFSEASLLLMIMAAGQFANLITGSVGYVLIMTGHERIMRNNVIFIALLNVCLNLLLVSRYGAVGAAVTTAVSLALQNLIAAWLVYKYVGITTTPALPFKKLGLSA